MDVKEELKKGLGYFQSNKQEMAELYKFVTGSAILVKCDLCIVNAFNELKERYDSRKYKMKRGAVIHNPWGIDPVHYSRHNTTDEISEKLIKLGYESLFE
jgi:hypothetical protein